MSESLSTTLEASERTRSGACDIAIAPCDVLERCGCIEHFAHLLGVGRPISSKAQCSVRCDDARKQFDEWRLNQSSLVMPLLRPRIGKEYVDERDRRRPQLLLQHIDGIVIHDAQVSQAGCVRAEQHTSHTWTMHLNADAVVVRVRLRETEQRFARAEPDLEHARRGAAEQRIEIKRLSGKLYAVYRP